MSAVFCFGFLDPVIPLGMVFVVECVGFLIYDVVVRSPLLFNPSTLGSSVSPLQTYEFRLLIFIMLRWIWNVLLGQDNDGISDSMADARVPPNAFLHIQ